MKRLVADLPPTLNVAIFIVWHMAPDIRGVLPQVLNKLNTIPARQARDMEPLQMNHIYIALPDRHLLLENDRLRTTRGPKENRFRPAVDPLFRAAAYEYGQRVIGVVLSGALDDGSAGLWTIKHRGGLAIVQDPDDAEMPSMPEKESEQRLRVTMDSATDFAIITFDKNGLIEGWSTGATNIFGYREEEAIGQHSAIVFTPEDHEANVPQEEMNIARQEGRAADERWHIKKMASVFLQVA